MKGSASQFLGSGSRKVGDFQEKKAI